MRLNPHYSLPQLVATFKRKAALAPEDGDVIASGLRAVLRDVTDAARLAAAHDPIRYDHRSLYEFCAALDSAMRASFRNE